MHHRERSPGGSVSRVTAPQTIEMMEDRAEVDGLRGRLQMYYGLTIHALIRLKTVFGVVCTDGQRWIWKPVSMHDPQERLIAVQRLAVYLNAAGIRAAAPVANRMGALISVFPDGTAGYLQPWVPGRHVDMAVRQERLTALATIGNAHNMAASVPFDDLSHLHRLPLPEKLHAKASFLMRIWPEAIRELPALEPLGADLQHVLKDVQAAVAENAPLTWERPLFCHRDLAPHNLLWDGSLSVALIDFDQAGLDDPFVDVMQWSNHAVFLGGAGHGHFHDCVEVYRRVCALAPGRADYLWRLLRFPDILIRALSEWSRHREAGAHRNRLLNAARMERQRWSVWEEDAGRWRAGRTT